MLWLTNSGRVTSKPAGGILLLGSLVLLGCASCGDGEYNRTHGDSPKVLILTRSLGGQPGSLDPQRAEDAFSYDVLRDLYEGLTASSPEGQVIPAAATAWKVSADGKNYVFDLRHEARWSNGDPVTAAHFVDGFRRALDSRTSSGAVYRLRAIDNDQ